MKKGKILLNDGFTMIELIIVIVILGILAAVAVPKIGDMVESSRIETTKANLSTIKQAIVGRYGYRTTVGYDPSNLGNLIDQGNDDDYDMFTKIGWKGPYINYNEKYQNNTYDFEYDAWSNALDLRAAEIRSAGPDGVMDNTDDIVISF
ncbi:prepilin-type N-terminal cleavage/methylation domain-containing protein [candidate division KSB1 bacterium]